MPVFLRRATPDDAEKLKPLIEASQLYQKRDLENEVISDTEAYRKLLEDRLVTWLQDPDKAYIIAEDDNRSALGFILCMTDGQVTKTGSLGDLYVIPGARREGTARALIEKAENWLLEKGCAKIILAVHKANEAATALYQDAGYTEKEDPYRLMEKDLA